MSTRALRLALRELWCFPSYGIHVFWRQMTSRIARRIPINVLATSTGLVPCVPLLARMVRNGRVLSARTGWIRCVSALPTEQGWTQDYVALPRLVINAIVTDCTDWRWNYPGGDQDDFVGCR